MTQVLSQRALNRATLARQYLLERAAVPAIDAIEHLGGMQSQAPLAPYVGLWTRLLHFDAGELSELTEQRQVVRAALMRNTVHLVSARDCLDWSAHFSGLRAAQFRARFGRGLDGVSRPALVERARLLLDEKPRTRVELRELLAGLLPDAEPDVLVHAVAHHIALCQVPPRGVWGRNGPVALVPVEAYLGARLRTTPMEDLVVRYLAAFGPASVADIQLWSGLTHLRELVERMPLREFHGENGQVLVDLPDAPRPHEDIPAPPRFLPEYDNLLLSHKDRTRLIPDPRRVPLPPGNGGNTGTFLIDGLWRGVWRVQDHTLHVRPFSRLRRSKDRDALRAEAARLGSFLAPEHGCDVVLDAE